MLINSQDIEVEQLKNNELMKQENVVRQNNIDQQKCNGTAKTSYLNMGEHVKQRDQIKIKKSLEPVINKEKEDGLWSNKHTRLSPTAKSEKIKNGNYYVFTSCNRETCRKNATENNLDTEKLKEIINNSIKEAMQSIAKEKPDILKVKENSLSSKEQSLLSNKSNKEPENKREKSVDQIKNLIKEDRSMSILNGFHKKSYPLSVDRNNIYENLRMSDYMNFIKNNVTTPNRTVDKCNEITCPHSNVKLEAKRNKIKKPMKSFKTPFKNSTTTDNRRMTGNVNIYICSEANNEKEKRESRESGYIATTEKDMKSSVSTISSNKLIHDILERRKRLRKSSQCLCRKSETVLESRIEEIPQEKKHLNDVVSDSYVTPALNPVSNFETGIINTNHENDIKNVEKNNTNSDQFNDNDVDHSCTVKNCPYLKGRSIRHRNYIKNNNPRNIIWSTKNNSIIPNCTVDCNCSCRKTICPYLFGNRSVTTIKRLDKYNVNNKRKDRLDGKWVKSDIQEVCVYCAPRKNKKVEQCSGMKLSKILKKRIEGTKRKEPLFKNFGTSQRRNWAEQYSFSNDVLNEEIELNNTNLNEDLPEKIDSQREEAYALTSYINGKRKASVDKLNVKDDVTMLPVKSELEKSSLLLSSINYEKKYQDKSLEKIGTEEVLSEDQDQLRQTYISDTEVVSPVIASPMVSDNRLDSVTTQKVTSALKSIEESVIIAKDELTSSIASAQVEKIAEAEVEEKDELDEETEEILKSTNDQKESFFQRVVNRLKQLIGFSNVTDNMNDKKRRGCGSSCRALPKNLVNDEDVEDQFPNEDTKEYRQPVVSSTVKSKKEETETTDEIILTRQSSKDIIISKDKMKVDKYKVESPKHVFNINKENASKAKLRRLIAKRKMLQRSKKDEFISESKEIKINKDTLETQEDPQYETSATESNVSKSFKDTMESITDRTEGSKTIKEYDSEKSKNFENLRSPKSSDKRIAKDSRIIEDTKNSVTNSKEIESQKSLTNSPVTISAKNLNSHEVSSNLTITKESANLHVSEDQEKSTFSKIEDYSFDHINSTENSESDSIKDDGTDQSYREFIESKKAQQIDFVSDGKESEQDFRVCIICCCPEDNCSCDNRNNIRTTICVNPTNSTYCDNFNERCACQNSICNCFHHNIIKNNCNCNCDKITDVTTCSCDKNNIVSDNNTIYVTAWKPAKDIEKYFSRTLEDFKYLPKECCCCENKKPYGSEELPYQRLGVFSKVMTELQEKINKSVSCKKCQNAPCLCAINETQKITKELAEGKTKSFDQSRSRSRSSGSCKCALNACNSLSWKISSSKIKDGHEPTSCCCRQSRSAQCRSRAKCFYCKYSPCRCIISRETSKTRSCRCDYIATKRFHYPK